MEAAGNNTNMETDESLKSILKTEEDYEHQLRQWFSLFMKQEHFIFPANYVLFHHKKTETSLSGYLNFSQMTNPSMSYNIMNQLQDIHEGLFSIISTTKKDKIRLDENYSFFRTFKAFYMFLELLG